MAVHVKELDILSYKGIKDLRLNSLNHVNILTGDNNSGKTSILELLSTLTDPLDQERWICGSRSSNTAYQGMPYWSFSNLFPIENNCSIVGYSYIDEYDKMHRFSMLRSVASVQMTMAEQRKIEGYKYIPKEMAENAELFDVNRLELELGYDEAVKQLSIFDFQSRMIRSNTLKYSRRKTKSAINAVYVSPTAHANRFSLADVLQSPEYYNDLLLLLKEFDEDIVHITAVDPTDGKGNSGIEYMVLSKRFDKALPLSSYGDGMKKALLIISSMLKAKNGILLLDEFETAIHTSAMDRIFSWLLNSAVNLNVQVFLTSHSKEAINKVLRCDEDLMDKISYYTLFNYDGKNLVRYLSCEDAIRLQDQGGLDIR